MARSDPEIIRCPTCRRVSRIPPGGVSSLPTNTVLVKFLEVTPGRKERSQIQRSLERSRPVVEQMEREVGALDRCLENVNTKWTKAEEDIRLTAEKLTQRIKMQESRFLENVKEVYGKKQKYLQHQRHNLSSMLNNVTSCVKLAENLLAKGDAEELIEMAGPVTQQLREIGLMNFDESGELQGQYEEELIFTSNRDLQTLLENKCFGEIKSRMIELKPPSLSINGDLSKIGRVIKKIGRKGSAKGNFKSPGGVASNEEGNIAVADYFNNCIQVFDESGKFLFKFGKKGTAAGQFMGPTGVTYSSVNEIIVLDSKNFRVQVFDCNGQFLRAFGKKGSNNGEFGSAEGISVDALDNIVVTDTENNRVQVFSSDGTFLLHFGGQGPEGFDTPLSTVYHNGELYTSDKGNSCIKVFDCNGGYLRQFGKEGCGGGEFCCPRGIAVDRQNDCIFVCDSGNDCVHVFKTNGVFVTKFECKKTPVGIALVGEKHLVVSSYFGHCIRILSYV